MNVLVVDVGGSHVKCLVTGASEKRKQKSGSDLTPERMVGMVRELADGWEHDVVSIGYPGVVTRSRPAGEPPHLGPGWVGFDFAGALGRPVRMLNDAALQAVGGYREGRMLFLGLGTGLGTALIVDGVIVPLEVGHLPYRKKGRNYEHYVGEEALHRKGHKRWTHHVLEVLEVLRAAFIADEVLLGGGNVRLIEELPGFVRRGANEDAFAGGERLWREAAFGRQVPVLEPARTDSPG